MNSYRRGPTDNMIDFVKRKLSDKVKQRVWIISDLQQHIPERAEISLTTAINDIVQMGCKLDKIWYLGDSVEGDDLSRLNQMAQMQTSLLRNLHVPLNYTLGNHDLDYARNNGGIGKPVIPFYDCVKEVPGWKTTENIEDFYFIDEIGDYMVVFFSDFVSENNEWAYSLGDALSYPKYSKEDFRKINDIIEKSGKKVITASHYSFAGGSRPSETLNQLLPLPQNVVMHFQAHAHIGDTAWGGDNCFRKISCVERQPIPIINVSSLEFSRGAPVMSVILEIYEDNALGVFFRKHEHKKWTDYYLMA